MKRDLTVGEPVKLILLFAVPLLIGNIFQQFYNMADTFIVGRILGMRSLAAVGSTGSIIFLIVGFVNGLTSGFAITIAQDFGAGRSEAVRKDFAAGIILSIAFSAILTILSCCLAYTFLKLLRTPPEIIEDAYRYIIVIYGGLSATFLFNYLSNTLRAFGDSALPLIFLVIACIINIILDYTLIGVFQTGTMGASIATVTAQLVSGLLCVAYICKKFPQLHLRRGDWEISIFTVTRLLKTGGTMGFQSSIIASGNIIFQFTVNSLGTQAVAAYTTAQKVDMIAMMPMMSFGIAMATYVGQNYGAGKLDRIRKGVIQCLCISGLLSIVLGFINIHFGAVLVSLFVPGQTAVIDIAHGYLAHSGMFYIMLAFMQVLRYSLQGVGKAILPAFSSILELCTRVSMSLILSAWFGFAGITWVNPLTWTTGALILTISYAVVIRRMKLADSA